MCPAGQFKEKSSHLKKKKKATNILKLNTYVRYTMCPAGQFKEKSSHLKKKKKSHKHWVMKGASGSVMGC